MYNESLLVIIFIIGNILTYVDVVALVEHYVQSTSNLDHDIIMVNG